MPYVRQPRFSCGNGRLCTIFMDTSVLSAERIE